MRGKESGGFKAAEYSPRVHDKWRILANRTFPHSRIGVKELGTDYNHLKHETALSHWPWSPHGSGNKRYIKHPCLILSFRFPLVNNWSVPWPLPTPLLAPLLVNPWVEIQQSTSSNRGLLRESSLCLSYTIRDGDRKEGFTRMNTYNDEQNTSSFGDEGIQTD